ncbi:MAG: phosphatidate cytidylyltransferase [Flavipsychrobacter sp.]
MKKLSVFAVLAMLLTLSSCQLVGDIFKAGVWVGVLVVVVVIGLVIFILAKLFGGGK